MRSKPVGWIRTISDSEVVGWAFDPAEPEQRQEVVVYLGDDPFGTAVANEFDENLRKAGKGDGCCKFTFRVPERHNVRSFHFRHKTSGEVIKIAGNRARPKHEDFRHSFVYGTPTFSTAVSEANPEDGTRICERIIGAFHEDFAGQSGMSYQAIWGAITNEFHQELIGYILNRDAAALSRYLADMHKTDVVHGVSQGRKTYETFISDRGALSRMSRIYWDRLISVAECVGALNFEDPMKLGRWGENLYTEPAELKRRLEGALGFKIDSPNPSGGLFGIDLDGVILDARMIEALYVAHRLRMLSAYFGTSVVEIGAGMGWSAYYSNRAGVRRYTIYDLPVMNVLQAYTLSKLLPPEQLALGGETPKDTQRPIVSIRSAGRFFEDQFGDGQLFFNQDSFPEIGKENMNRYLTAMANVPGALLLSINQECQGKSGPSERLLVAREEIENFGKYDQLSRAAYWPRPGYVEELFAVKSKPAMSLKDRIRAAAAVLAKRRPVRH